MLYNFAPSTYWKEYVENYFDLRTMQIMRVLGDADEKSHQRRLRQFFYRLRIARSYVKTSINLICVYEPGLMS
ncbi:hypothetical protein J6590_090432 [Homalodisca vitripennis]|nr:hypothetical protein J6590_090432 [Homalodisca vitripennis]